MLALAVLFVACGNDSSPKDSEATITDGDDVVLVVDDGDELLNDAHESPDEDILAVECHSTKDCGENEVCDPYGDCVCDQRVRLPLKYDGVDCMGADDLPYIFCNGKVFSIMLSDGPEMKGYTTILKKGEEAYITCACVPGFEGEFCERSLEGYPDKLPHYPGEVSSIEEYKKFDSLYNDPEPNCVDENDCPEGMICGETGLCECVGPIEFKDNRLKNIIFSELNKNTEDSVTGAELNTLKEIPLDNFYDLSGIKCLQRLRNLAVVLFDNGTDLSEIRYLKNLQRLTISQREDVYGEQPCDLSWVGDLKNLLELDLTLNYTCLPSLNAAEMPPFVTSFELYLEPFEGDMTTADFSFVGQFEHLSYFTLKSYDYAGADYVTFHFDLALLAKNKFLRWIILENPYGSASNPATINEFKLLHTLNLLTATSIKELQPNEKVRYALLSGDTADAPIAERFPRLRSLTIRDYFGVFDFKNLEGADLFDFAFLGNYTDFNSPYAGYGEILAGMKNLRRLLFFPITEPEETYWMKDKKYLNYLRIDADNNDLTYEEIKDISVVADMLYLTYYDDDVWGATTLQPFVDNCKNGGALCRNDAAAFSLAPDGAKGVLLWHHPLDKKEETDNITYLEEHGVKVIINQDPE